MKYKYAIQYIGEFGRHIASFIAYDAEDLAEQFFKIHKHVDYKILFKEDVEEPTKHQMFTYNKYTGLTYYHGFEV